MKKVTVLFLAIAAVFSASAAENKNLLQNTEFLNGYRNWGFWKPQGSTSRYLVVKDNPADRFKCLGISTGNASGSAIQVIPVTPGDKLKISLSGKITEPAAGAVVGVRWFNANNKFLDVGANSSLQVVKQMELLPEEWGKLEFEVTVPNGAAKLSFSITGKGTDVKILFKEISIVKVTQ